MDYVDRITKEELEREEIEPICSPYQHGRFKVIPFQKAYGNPTPPEKLQAIIKKADKEHELAGYRVYKQYI